MWFALLVVGMVGAENVKIEDLDLAITAATGGEEFTVSAGTYTRTMQGSNGVTFGIVIHGKAMTIVGEGSDSSILDGGNDHPCPSGKTSEEGASSCEDIPTTPAPTVPSTMAPSVSQAPPAPAPAPSDDDDSGDSSTSSTPALIGAGIGAVFVGMAAGFF